MKKCKRSDWFTFLMWFFVYVPLIFFGLTTIFGSYLKRKEEEQDYINNV